MLLTGLNASVLEDQVGKKYVWGAKPCKNLNGCSSYDCSALVQWNILTTVGKTVPRTIKGMVDSNLFRVIKIKDLQVGDVLLWGVRKGYPSHASIYLGSGLHISAEHPDFGVVVVKLWKHQRLGKWRGGYYVTHYNKNDLNRILRLK